MVIQGGILVVDYVLELMVKLQEIDSNFQNLEQQKGSLPAQITEISGKLAEITQKIETAEKELAETSRKKRQNEIEVKSLENQLEKYKKQIYSVTTNKEYDAITAEVETTEIEISDLETEVLEFMELEEKLKPQIETDRASQDQIDKILTEKKVKLSKLIELTQQKQQELIDERNELVKKIDRPILATYERIRNGKDGLAVVPIENGVCTGCYRNLPPQLTLEIKRMEDLIYCQTCGRLLVWLEKEEENVVDSE